MKLFIAALLCCCVMTAVFACAQGMDEGFQMARVAAFDHVAADAQHMENSDQYKISMRLGDTVYLCHASGSASLFLDWSMGKEFPTRLDGKVLHVKGPHGEAELNIQSKKAAK